ncbi:polysaccharide deacetylase family protein [Lamprobacter modestohalophilus]|uniref:polysaccharide deacetylase family protein n=1 Tax=Lamprobacter modestohalophilus TaxID=1064514 RepID=UPI002ADEB627|nr:polysaccharide deacetylase family protein [Lamprobacter modestohalophilus]MEA1051036.1 polysaccharide deacetylase family protein [Lamprobacter modestohalophilus]
MKPIEQLSLATEATLPKALISVHDLMPETMPAVHQTLKQLEQHRLTPVTLLVVPGRNWSRSGIETLRSLERDGYRLAGHGWHHQAERIGGLYHRLHSLFLSRRVAEHLALDEAGIIALINRCHAWFSEQGLTPPTLYVPPAWAMGSISIPRLRESCPFSLYERFDAVIDCAAERTHPLPLSGYEADNALRAPVLRLWNRWNWRNAQRQGLPIRIGIHPRDLELKLADALKRDLSRSIRPVDYDSLLGAAG